jgi:hypothetical protein
MPLHLIPEHSFTVKHEFAFPRETDFGRRNVKRDAFDYRKPWLREV